MRFWNIAVLIFTTHVIQLNQGDMIYTFSDGYPDQFGGPKNKKYKSKNLKRFLLSIQGQPMKGQKGMLQTEFHSWRKSNEQVDDVCVIGVRV